MRLVRSVVAAVRVDLLESSLQQLFIVTLIHTIDRITIVSCIRRVATIGRNKFINFQTNLSIRDTKFNEE